uniref:DUF4283 domain-containing protein n=1 Tax=Oryza glaberrima TaxID=4538 RepID=I1PU45_ORYGL
MAARPRDEGAKSRQGWDDGAAVNQQFNLRNQQGLGRHPQHQFQRPPVIPRRDQDDTLRSDQQARKFQPQAELAHRITLDWKWEAIPHGERSFLVAFPSFEELKRMDDV